MIGVDYVDSALVKARAKASVAKVEATFVQGDVTKLHSADVGDNFDLIVDYGCLHHLKGSDLEAYARAVTAVAAPTAQLTIMAFAPGALLGVPGVTSDGSANCLPTAGSSCRLSKKSQLVAEARHRAALIFSNAGCRSKIPRDRQVSGDLRATTHA